MDQDDAVVLGVVLGVVLAAALCGWWYSNCADRDNRR
jgi:hypothetical protein